MKENLIEIISSNLMERLAAKKIKTIFAKTSKDELPEETKLRLRIKQRDLKPLFYEGDYYIPRQVDRALKEDRNLIRVICSDTDVLVLLCTMYIVKKIGPLQTFIRKIS